jgi:hypothetical protein
LEFEFNFSEEAGAKVNMKVIGASVQQENERKDNMRLNI